MGIMDDRTKEDIEAINMFQGYGTGPLIYCHPLTCGNDSGHKLLQPRKVAAGLVLYCENCDYIQIVTHSLLSRIYGAIEYEPIWCKWIAEHGQSAAQTWKHSQESYSGI